MAELNTPPKRGRTGDSSNRLLPLSKKILFWSILLGIMFLFLEATAYVVVHNLLPTRVKNRAAFTSAEDYIREFKHSESWRLASALAEGPQATGEEMRRLRMFDHELGWDYPPGMQYTDAAGISYSHGDRGERKSCASYPSETIATYGDSFTYCEDVRDCETWQTYLAEKLDRGVLNFGVAGYGTDQAFLKYKLNRAGVKTPIVMLGILPDDINRVVSIFRTFAALYDRMGLTKPRFMKVNGRFVLIPNPIRNRQELVKLSEPEFVHRIGQLDYWYRKDTTRPSISPPYVRTAWRWRDDLVHRAAFRLSLLDPQADSGYYPDNLFEEREPAEVMRHIVDRFTELARSRGAVPIIVIMPHKTLVLEQRRHKVSRVRSLIEHLQRHNYRYVDLIERLAAGDASEEEMAGWFDEHATAAGNRVIADILAAYIEETLPNSLR